MIRSQSCRSQRVLALSLFMRLFAAVILFKRLPTDYLRTCYEFCVSLGLLHPHTKQRCPAIVLAKAKGNKNKSIQCQHFSTEAK